ncbi:MAG TPA: hypothetical protein DGD08_11090 [Gemmatimonas aurantiaca]|uniref:Cytochrome c domain-containing protein n=2 Tax=Gemmatimonas aurantiaca TaxID=173480 RepID=C1ACM9_GEMAT|nr:hypothetical protein [Gemmatimonas aurantiaca]BAH40256.1 hypothetical protein GAU_3214 [Gemmatimonas aurantiaca T-27]HCT57734.1 hypothetical protein [Gemmatimonas aurantiaca]
MRALRGWIAAVVLAGAAGLTRPVMAQDTTALDPVMRLQAKLEAGTLTLAHDSVLGYLPAVLKALDIPSSSQTLVFSRTSLQTDKITPWSPRALYFNDDVYVGYVFDSDFLEIAAVHPTAGARFYTFGQAVRPKPRFARETTTCLMCHQSRSVTGGVPGFMVLSTLVDRHGYPITGVHEGATTDATPVRQRFGGWYVTGTHGTIGHSGNVYAPVLGHQVADKAQYRTQFNMRTESALTSLAGKFDSTYYLTTQSDIVAILVLTHQTIMHNLITATHEAAREALLEAAIAPPETRAQTPQVSPRLRGAVETLVRGMLFVNAAPLEGPVRGTTTFATDFMAHGPRDPQGRSLRALDLEKRLFKYPLSFLIHSEAFDALPEIAKRAIYVRLDGILRGTDRTPDLQNIPAEDRRVVLEILTATKPEFTKMRTP